MCAARCFALRLAALPRRPGLTRLMATEGNRDVQKQGLKMFLAAGAGDVETLLAMADAGPPGLGFATQDGTTLTCVAARFGQAKMVQVLVDKGANLDLANKLGMTAVHVAAGSGHAKVVQMLADEGANLDLADKESITPTCRAAMYGHTEVVQVLADKGANLDLADKFGVTPTCRAAVNGHAEAVRVLAEKGANLDLADKNGYTPTCLAAVNGHAEAVRVLAENGANLDLDLDALMPERTPSPLRVELEASAVRAMGVQEMVEVMVKHGVDFGDCTDEESLRERLLENIASAS